jgi:hypothetical protein
MHVRLPLAPRRGCQLCVPLKAPPLAFNVPL